MTSTRRHFTLMEIAMAMAAFVIGAMALMGLLTATSKTNVDNRKKAMISLLAARKIEELKIKAWTKTYAATTTEDASFLNPLLAQNLTNDSEIPELACIVEMEVNKQATYMSNVNGTMVPKNRNIIRYGVFAKIGITVDSKDNLLNNGDYVTGTIKDGGSITCTLTEDQYRRFQNGGHICAKVSPDGNDAIFSFNHIDPQPPVGDGTQPLYTLQNLSHYFHNSLTASSPTISSGNCKVYFLDFVTFLPITMRNKLFLFLYH